MPAQLTHEHDDVYRLEVSGRLSSAELDTAGRALVDGMRSAPAAPSGCSWSFGILRAGIPSATGAT